MKKTDLSKTIMDSIKKDHVRIKPKALFVIGSFLLGAGLTVAIIISLIFLSASAFHIRTQNPLGFLRLGLLGGPAFLKVFPFQPMLFAAISIFVGLYLLKKYDFSYKRNFLSISIAIVGAITILSIAADRLGANEKLGKVRTLKPLYRQEFEGRNMIMGEVVSASKSAIEIVKPGSKDSISVTWDENTALPFGSEFEVGDRVGVVGKYVDGTIYARGIHKGKMMWRKQRDSSGSAPPRPTVKGIHQLQPRER